MNYLVRYAPKSRATDRCLFTPIAWRDSTLDHDLEKNKADILHLANEKYLGKVSWKQRKIAQVLEDLDKGDVILLSEFSHLGRSMLECMEIISIAIRNQDLYCQR